MQLQTKLTLGSVGWVLARQSPPITDPWIKTEDLQEEQPWHTHLHAFSHKHEMNRGKKYLQYL